MPKAKSKTHEMAPAISVVRKVAETATLQLCSVIDLHASTTVAPEKTPGKHRFSMKTNAFGRALDDKSAEILVSLQIGIQRQDSDKPWALLASTIRLVYGFSAPTPAQADLDAFAKVNGVYNAWPYLREIVQSTTMRMGIAPLMLPMFRVGPKPQAAAK